MFFLLLCACTPADDGGGAIRSSPTPDSGSDDTGRYDTGRDDTDDTAPDDTASLSPAVAFTAPADGSTVENPVSFSFTAHDVAWLTLDADGYAMGTVSDPAETGSLAYTFSGTGYERLVTLTGYDASGAAVASDTVTITVDAPGVDLDVPYFYQMENAHDPTGTCGVTSGAMLVDYWHAGSVTPDSLYEEYGKSQGQSPSGLAALYEYEGLYADYSLTATRSELRDQLDAGRPVIVHGYFTGSGHIVVIVGYDDGGWYTNDSAGDWAEGYFNTHGEGAYYPYGGGWDDALGVDGDIWYSVADDAPL